MTHKMHEKAEAARALTRLEMAVRVLVHTDDDAGVASAYSAYARAGGCYTLDDIEKQEGVSTVEDETEQLTPQPRRKVRKS